MTTAPRPHRQFAEVFPGFAPLNASFVYCPNQFLDRCVTGHNRAVSRTVGFILHQTLRLLDNEGRPVRQDIAVSFDRLVRDAGVSRGGIRSALDEAIGAGFLTCTRAPARNEAGRPARVGEYALRWDAEFTTDQNEFRGFYAGDGRRTPVPHQFFTHVLPAESLGVIRVVAAVMRHTVGYTNQFGNRRHEAPLSYRVLQRYANISSSTLAAAIRMAQARGYIVATEPGSFSVSQKDQRPTTYALRWLSEAVCANNGSKTEVDNSTVQQSKQRQFKNRSRNGSKTEAAKQSRNRSTKKEVLKETTNKQQAAATDHSEIVGLLRAEGFDRRSAEALAQAHPAEKVRRQLDWAKHRNATVNRLGMIRKAIEEDWPQPAGVAAEADAHRSSQLEEEKRRAAKLQAEALAKADHEQQARRRQLLSIWEELAPEAKESVFDAVVSAATSEFSRQRLRRNRDFAHPPPEVLSYLASTALPGIARSHLAA